jgi:hypothetical protein
MLHEPNWLAVLAAAASPAARTGAVSEGRLEAAGDVSAVIM